MISTDVMRYFAYKFQDALYVSTCGYISRDLYNTCDRPGNFYLVGAMGMAAPLGLGLCLAQPSKTIIVFDGDGSFLMNLGITMMIAQQKPTLVHVILDNGMHESTGGQFTVQSGNFVDIALAAGYRHAEKVENKDQLDCLTIKDMPYLLHCSIQNRVEKIGKRIDHAPQYIVTRFVSNF